MIKKAVILAAGRGTRLQPLTYDLPKPMIPLLGKPVMEYIVDHLARQGVREIMVNTSHPATHSGSVAYLVSRYPAVSHTFILREVQGLRALGLRVEVASVNAPDRLPERMSDGEREESEATYGIKRHGVRGALAALTWAAAMRPLALVRTLHEAFGLGRGMKRIYALAYAVEAVMVTRWMARRGLQHLHVHFGNEAALVGMLA